MRAGRGAVPGGGDEALISAWLLDGRGGGREIGWEAVRAGAPPGSVLWVHLDRKAPESQQYLRAEAGLDPLAVEVLLAEETRPRTLVDGDRVLLILRGVNLNPGADPEDMVSIRVHAERGRVITLRHRRLLAVQDLADALRAGRGPAHPSDLLVQLCDRLVARMEPVIDDLDEAISSCEQEMLAGITEGMRGRLGGLRREAIGMRRYLAPQREALSRLAGERVPWLDDLDRSRLREVGDRVTRYLEDLDAARERAAVVQEELASRISEQMNRTMYVLSLVAGLFLPLGLLTGLLGINVGGIPGTGNPHAFLEVCGLLVAVAAFQIWLFRRMDWF
jgi:zinc transporter